MKYLLAVASLMATCIPVQAGNVYLLIKSEGEAYDGYCFHQ